jgi:hypothetical protein
MGGFATIQARYAAHNIATYPLKADKTPAVRAYGRIGAPYSAKLAAKHPDAEAGGFVAGARNGVTVVDIDSPDNHLVDDIQARFGLTPFQVLTPSGGRHLYYRHGGETRLIRPLPDIDILGVGNVVAAGSVVAKGRYQIERGSLDDLDRLPRLASPPDPVQARRRVPEGTRNDALFDYCRSMVRYCDTLEQLLDAARTWASQRLEIVPDHPVSDAEIVKTCRNVWTYRGGRKRFMNHFFDAATYNKLITRPDAMALAFYLSCENGPRARFWIADGLGRSRGWPYRLVPRARKALLALGIVECIRPSRKGAPALYRWCPQRDE